MVTREAVGVGVALTVTDKVAEQEKMDPESISVSLSYLLESKSGI